MPHLRLFARAVIAFVVLSICYSSCVPPDGTPTYANIELDLRDSTFREIITHQDRQNTKALMRFLQAENPNYRYAAARAFGSIKSVPHLDSLSILLKDPLPQVREVAAFSLGQIGTPDATSYLLQAFERNDSMRTFAASNGAILEAVGKCGDKEQLDLLATISTYTATDTLLLLGQVYGIYRFGQRGIFSSKGTSKMLEAVADKRLPSEVRMVAAQYLARFKEVVLRDQALILANAFTREDVPEVRMPLALAVGKTEAPEVVSMLSSQFGLERNPLVQANILRSLYKFDYETVQTVFERAVLSSNPQVAEVAATFFLERGTVTDAYNYYKTSRDTTVHPLAAAQLLRASNRYLPAVYEAAKGAINYRAKRLLETEQNPYVQAAAVRALAEFGWNYRYLKEKAFVSTEPVVRVASMEGFKIMTDNPDFSSFFGAGSGKVARDLAAYIQEAFEIGDPGMVAVGAQILRSTNVDFKEVVDSIGFLELALKQLQLPKEIEAYNEIERTIAYFQDTEVALKTPEFNHPIAWELLDRLKETSVARLETSKGSVTVQLFANETPGTAANFIDLIRQGFYKNKTFHRVVPNFVAQGGCPRGDGYGALDYTIRSELTPRRYNEGGFLGMASAGNHTESVQFFVTHSPTIHLDGNYTLFGKVIEGMDVVLALEIGDTIKDITISAE